MPDNPIEVADVFRRYGDLYSQQFPISPEQLKVLNLIKACRTATLGGHLHRCEHCGYEKPAYNSCRNRHCPKCQTVAKEKWLDARRVELLPCGYFHLVFTLPHELNAIILGNKEKLLGLLFSTVNQVLQRFAQDPQWRLVGKIGYLAVLHTWSQTLLDHFHLHCLVPAGVLSLNEQKWIKARKRYLFRTESLAKALRHQYTQQLAQLYQDGQLYFAGKTQSLASPVNFAQLVHKIKEKQWIVYAKRPFAGPQQVLDYLGRYTHRVAISNHRLLALENDQVTFAYRDRSDGDTLKSMTLAANPITSKATACWSALNRPRGAKTATRCYPKRPLRHCGSTGKPPTRRSGCFMDAPKPSPCTSVRLRRSITVAKKQPASPRAKASTPCGIALPPIYSNRAWMFT